MIIFFYKLHKSDYSKDELISTQIFGDKPFPTEIGAKMREQLHQDLINGDEFDYQSPVGLFDLYRRAGGSKWLTEMASITRDLVESVSEQHPLIISLREAFDEADGLDGQQDGCLTARQFYDRFLARFLPCYSCKAFKELMHIVDVDGDGTVQWSEMLTYAQWALIEYPDASQHWSLDDLVEKIFHDHIMSRSLQIHDAPTSSAFARSVSSASYWLRGSSAEMNSGAAEIDLGSFGDTPMTPHSYITPDVTEDWESERQAPTDGVDQKDTGCRKSPSSTSVVTLNFYPGRARLPAAALQQPKSVYAVQFWHAGDNGDMIMSGDAVDGIACIQASLDGNSLVAGSTDGL